MGHETKCRVRVDDRTGIIRAAANATVLPETDELIVRGEARVKIPRASIERVSVRAGVVMVIAPSAVLSLTLGEAAVRWRAKPEAVARVSDTHTAEMLVRPAATGRR